MLQFKFFYSVYISYWSKFSTSIFLISEKCTETFYLQLSFYSIRAFYNLNSSQEVGIQIGQRKSEFSPRKMAPGVNEHRILRSPFKTYSPWVLKTAVYWPTFNGYVQDHQGLPRWLSSRESACNAGDIVDTSLIPMLGRSPGGRNGNPLQYSCLENPMDRGAWWATYSPWDGRKSDTTERLSTHTSSLSDSMRK